MPSSSRRTIVIINPMNNAAVPIHTKMINGFTLASITSVSFSRASHSLQYFSQYFNTGIFFVVSIRHYFSNSEFNGRASERCGNKFGQYRPFRPAIFIIGVTRSLIPSFSISRLTPMVTSPLFACYHFPFVFIAEMIIKKCNFQSFNFFHFIF